MTAPVLCDDCHRSVWLCNGADECRSYVASMLACSAASHDRMKRTRPSVLLYRGLQRDDQGEAVLVWLDCPKCGSTLAVNPSDWLASAVYSAPAANLRIVR